MSHAVPAALSAVPPYTEENKSNGVLVDEEDALIIAGLREGDTWAIELVYGRYHTTMVCIAMSYIHNRTLAEDIVQEAWIGVLRSITRFEGRCTLKTWIMRIVHYRARTWQRKERSSISFSALQDATHGDTSMIDQVLMGLQPVNHLPTPSLEEQVMMAETGNAILNAIADLPEVQRAVVMLRDVIGWPATDVCRHLDLSDGNQRVLLHRARRRLREVLLPDQR